MARSFSKWIFGIAVLICMLAAIGLIAWDWAVYIQKYKQSDMVIVSTAKRVRSLAYPRFMICPSRSRYNRAVLNQYLPSYFQYETLMDTLMVPRQQAAAVTQPRLLNPNDYVDYDSYITNFGGIHQAYLRLALNCETIISCIANDSTYNCCSAVRPVTTVQGPCLQFSISDRLATQPGIDGALTVKMTVDRSVPDNDLREASQPFSLYFVDNEGNTLEPSNQLLLDRNREYMIALYGREQRYVMDIQNKLSMDESKPMNWSKVSDQSLDCFADCLGNAIQSQCSCRPFYALPPVTTTRPCDHNITTNCIIPMLNGTNPRASSFEKTCQSQCYTSKKVRRLYDIGQIMSYPLTDPDTSVMVVRFKLYYPELKYFLEDEQDMLSTPLLTHMIAHYCILAAVLLATLYGFAYCARKKQSAVVDNQNGQAPNGYNSHDSYYTGNYPILEAEKGVNT